MEKLLRRKVDKYLMDWKNNPDRKPLIIKGARQIGKTRSIEWFANQNYKCVVQINFVEQTKYKGIFDDGFEVTSGFSESNDTIRGFIKDLKELVDDYRNNPDEYLD